VAEGTVISVYMLESVVTWLFYVPGKDETGSKIYAQNQSVSPKFIETCVANFTSASTGIILR